MRKIGAHITGAILAGGRSSRMGRNKALLEYQGERLADRAVRRFRSVFDEVLLVANDASAYRDAGVPVVADLVSGMGPLGGLHAALRFATHDRVFLAACDMPFAEPAMAPFLDELAPDADVVVPVFRGTFETMHALYGRGALPAIEAALRAARPKMIGFYDQVEVRPVTESELGERFGDLALAFWNLNTPEDYLRLLRGLGPPADPARP